VKIKVSRFISRDDVECDTARTLHSQVAEQQRVRSDNDSDVRVVVGVRRVPVAGLQPIQAERRRHVCHRGGTVAFLLAGDPAVDDRRRALPPHHAPSRLRRHRQLLGTVQTPVARLGYAQRVLAESRCTLRQGFLTRAAYTTGCREKVKRWCEKMVA